MEFTLHFCKNLQCFFIADRCKGIAACAVRFFVGRLEDEGYPVPLCNRTDSLRSLENHFAILNDARSSDEHQRMVTADVNCADRYGFRFRGIHSAADVFVLENIRKNGGTIKETHFIQILASTTLLHYFKIG
jgi:hypothetical protein